MGPGSCFACPGRREVGFRFEEKYPEPPLLPADALGQARVRALALIRFTSRGNPASFRMR
jgi:glutathione S-transferase